MSQTPLNIFLSTASHRSRYGVLCIFFIALFALSGCNTTDYDATPKPDSDDDLVTFAIRVPRNGTPDSSLPATRAMSAVDESHIAEVDILVFDPSGGNFRYYATAKTITKNPENSTADYLFTAMLEEITSCDLVIIANARAQVSAFVSSKGATPFTKAELQAGLNFTNNGKWNTTTPTPIPMWAEDNGRTVVKETVIEGIMLHRMLSRINLRVAADNFELREVYLYNAPTQGAVIPATANWDATWKPSGAQATDPATGKATGASMPSGYSRTALPLIYKHTDNEMSATACVNEIYTFESPAGDGTPGPNNTYLVFGGLYDGSTEVTYYRFDVAAKNSANQYQYLPLLRNHTYEFTLNTVSRPGYPTADIAAAGGPENAGVVLVVEHDDDLRYYISDSHYYLGATEKIVRLPYSASQWTTNLKIKTNYTPGWTVKASDSETDPDLGCSWVSINTPTPSTGDELTYTVGVNDGWAVRRAYLHISAGVNMVITLEQESTGGVELPTVSPTGNIPSAGQTRTVTVTGLFTTGIEVRVRDKYESTPIDNGTVPANSPLGNPSTTTLTIPVWNNEADRHLVFEYLDPANTKWIIFHEDIQLGYGYTVTTNLTPGGTLPLKPGVSDHTVTVSGTAWPQLQVRALDLTSLEVISTVPTLPAGNDGVSKSVTVPVQAYKQWTDQPSRSVAFQYSTDGINWNTIQTGKQQGFYRIDNVSHTLYHPGNTQRYNISHDGARVVITITGDFDDGVVEVRLGPDEVQVERSVDWISANTPTELFCRYNRTILPRTIPISYRKLVNNGWEAWRYETTGGTSGNIATYTQPSIAFEMPETGRILAREDCSHFYDFYSYTSYYMSWAIAMGIPWTYNLNIYDYDYTSGYPSYDISNGGCAAYYEGADPNDAVRGQGKWYLWGDGRNEYTGEAKLFTQPRSLERDALIGMVEGKEYWTFMPSGAKDYMSTVQILDNRWALVYKYKPTEKYLPSYNPPYFINTRCVRFPSPDEQKQIDGGGYASDVITTY